MSTLSTHVLDTSSGRPAAELEVTLKRRRQDGAWETLAVRRTDVNGRISDLGQGLGRGTFSLGFAVAPYFNARQVTTFYPYVEIVFDCTSSEEHYHVPLLISPFGYSTYRGS